MLITAAPQMENLGLKWRKNAPPSVVLFGTDGRGQACIIEYEGRDISYFFEVDQQSFIDEELATWQFPGLWVWEGKVRTSVSWEGEYDASLEGEVRPLTEDEARAIREGDHLWDPNLWIEET